MAQLFRTSSGFSAWFSAPDIPFSRDDSNRFLPWIVAFMVCLTGLMLAASLSLGTVMQRLSGDYSQSFTIQIPARDAKGVDSAELLSSIRGNEWVAEATEISKNEMRSLIEPWLGEGEGIDNLPLPVLIEVRLHDGANLDLAAFERRVRQFAPHAEIDDYQQWLGHFGQFSAGVQYTVAALAVLIILTTLAIVVLAAKTALRLHQQTVEVLYTIGAQDDYIATQFQNNAMRLVLRGAVMGTVVAAGLFWLSQGLTVALDSPLLPVFDFSMLHALLFVALPLITAAAALFSTRFAVLSLLKRKP